MKTKSFLLFLIGVLPSFISPVRLAGQVSDSSSACITRGHGAAGPIVAGTISNFATSSTGPTISLTVNGSLRGNFSAGDTIQVPVDWVPGTPIVMRPPAWYGIRSDVGKHVLVMFFGEKGDLRPVCVVDLDSHPTSTDVVKHMIALDKTPNSQKIGAMETALSDRSVAVRNEAVQYLTSPSMTDVQVRSKVFEHFAPIASDSKNPNRVEALEFIKRAYDGWSAESDLNYRILSFVGDQMADADPQVRSVAVQFIHFKVSRRGQEAPKSDPSAIERSSSSQAATGSRR